MSIKEFKIFSAFVLGITVGGNAYSATSTCSIDSRCNGVGPCGNGGLYCSGNCIYDPSCGGENEDCAANTCPDGRIPLPPLCECTGGVIELCNMNQYTDINGDCQDCPLMPSDQNCMIVGLGTGIESCKVYPADFVNPCIATDSTGTFEISDNCPYSQS